MTGPAHQGFAIGVDLGTSNTVAMLRGPDGRTRPLLFDGQPVLPSVILLDDTGRIQVGRDAQRMAQLDPARCEPNPKRRIDEPAILLGDREVPVVQLLAAILRAIADKAVEAVGFLPPAAITHPAEWGPVRRGVLTEAVRLAGWPPATLVPEPIAAARYFAEVMRRPVPVGSALAVFDFGGGTLDVAVVRNDGHGFTVIGTGGDEHLGGLDLDAVLVNHLGAVIGQRYPQIWQHLSQPVSSTDRRYRRLFWEDVRGAKEMLSRTAAAPVSVPGMDQAVHLTRDELERLAGPLLNRAVQATGNTISRAGLRADQLSGMFLVGGASRVPLVSRLLHAQLGIAPTALEQPELPVAEGALAELAPAPGATPPSGAVGVPAAVSGAPASGAPVSGQPVSPAGFDQPPGPYPPVAAPAPTPWYRRKGIVLPGAAAVLALLVLAGIALFYNQYPERGFQSLKSAGSAAYGTDSPSDKWVSIADGVGYVFDDDSKGKAQVRAYTLGAKLGSPKWTKHFDSGDANWTEFAAYRGIVQLRYRSTGDTPGRYVALDPATGRQLWTGTPASDDDRYTVLTDAGMVLHYDDRNRTITGLDLRNGNRKWGPVANAGKDIDLDDDWSHLQDAAPFSKEYGFEEGKPHGSAVVTVAGGQAQAIDARTGKVLGRHQVPEKAITVLYDGVLYETSGQNGYTVRAYPLDDFGKPSWSVVADQSMRDSRIRPCGETRVCVLAYQGTDSTSSDDQARTTTIQAYDTGSGKLVWHRKLAGAEATVPVGDLVLVNYADSNGQPMAALLDDGGNVTRSWTGDQAARLDSGTVLLVTGRTTGPSGGSSWPMLGAGARSDSVTQLGTLSVKPSDCQWTDQYLVCPEDKSFTFYQFRP